MVQPPTLKERNQQATFLFSAAGYLAVTLYNCTCPDTLTSAHPAITHVPYYSFANDSQTFLRHVVPTVQGQVPHEALYVQMFHAPSDPVPASATLAVHLRRSANLTSQVLCHSLANDSWTSLRLVAHTRHKPHEGADASPSTPS